MQLSARKLVAPKDEREWILLSIRDDTERRRAEQQREALARDLQKQADDLEVAKRAALALDKIRAKHPARNLRLQTGRGEHGRK
jgi:hypothetical protein